MMSTEDQVRILASMTNRDEAGRHFTARYADEVIDELESLGLVAIDRPVHQASGIGYSQEYWTLDVTQAGVDLVEAYRSTGGRPMPETPQKPIPSFQLRLPEVSTRKVWVGFSSDDRGTTITVFSRCHVMDEARGEYRVDFASEVAEIWVTEWEAWFGSLQPFADAGLIEHRGEEIGWVTLPKQSLFEKVIPINLTAAWDDDGDIVGLIVDAYN